MHDLATIHIQNLTRNESSALRGEEHDGTHQVFGHLLTFDGPGSDP